MGGKAGSDDDITRRLEDQLIAATWSRTVVDLRDRRGRWELPARVLQELCCERVPDVGRYGVRVAGARITGLADLRAVDVPFGLEFRDCVFDEPLVVEGARLHELAIVSGSRLPGLLANGLQIRRDLSLSGAVLHGALSTTASTSMTSAIWLTEADVGGRLLCVGTEITGPADRALQADRTHFGGNIRMIHGFLTDGEVRLIAVQLDGSLDLTGARLHPKNQRALDLGEAHIGGSVFIIDDEEQHENAKPEIRGRLEMGHARIEGRILVRNAALIGPQPGEGGHHYLSYGTLHRSVLSAPRVSVQGDLLFTGSCQIEGGLDLQMAEIQGDVRLDDQVLWNPGDPSVDLTTAAIGGTVSARGLRSSGTVVLAGARIQGSLRFGGANLEDPADGDGNVAAPPSQPLEGLPSATQPAVLFAPGVTIAGDVDLRSTAAYSGQVMFRAASVRGDIDAGNAKLHNHGGDALVLDYAAVDGDVRLADGFQAHGTVSLVGLTTKGIINLTDATITNDAAEPALVAVNARADGAMFLRWRRVEPWVNLDGASTPAIWDDPESWPARISIVGFEYERFWKEPALSQWDVRKRIAWLARQDPLDAAPYEHLARVLRDRGQPQRAETVQVAYLRRERDGLNQRGRVASFAWDKLTLYGFQPWRVIAIMGLLVLLLAGLLLLSAPRDSLRATGSSGTLYSPDGPIVATDEQTSPCGNGDVRCLRPMLYGIDVVVPLVDLGQRQTWRPEPHAPWGSAMEAAVVICTLLGWTLSTVFALSFTRMARGR
jgi:hypothetical protein